ncbi:bone morphogenetic protein receptor type-2-like isoform X2 [Carassius auratus]|uniref:receptor protein serine/threonine kinase n=1 Tax=Carassius auratus TaxID=7957 RepID=A0A6P6KCB4_CARAU|nr:bone morphogenetic protein receptor type-2-like isoform X2 [Carassius auratus]
MAVEGRITILDVGLIALVVLLGPVAAAQSEQRVCAYLEDTQGDGQVFRENSTIRCNHGGHCFGLWLKKKNKILLEKQGCWTNLAVHQECYDHCVVTNQPSVAQNGSFRFCCCNKDMCNLNFTEDFPTPSPTTAQHLHSRQLYREEVIVVALATVSMVAFLAILLFFSYRMLRGRSKHSLHTLDILETALSPPSLDLDNLVLLELIGRGRYGTVYHGLLDERSVAAKVFVSANRQQFTNERMIYYLLLDHDNVARFLESEERVGTEGRTEFLLLLEFYPHGSLCTYLSGRTVDWLSCCRLALSVTRGLAYLHTEIQRGDVYKPAVSHRDLNSRNVLVKTDGSCVISDFGLSMIVTGKRPPGHGEEDNSAISEVGTVRYMAPEVLEGAVNLKDCESALKQVDVYALGLLYWETFMRCADLFPGETVPAFQMAFQAELGNHPTIEDMQAFVSREKERPKFPEAWKENSLTVHSLKETIEDCWDQDAEARLTAQCAEERLAELLLIWDREKSVSPALNPSTALFNHRNISAGKQTPKVGSFLEHSSTNTEGHSVADKPLHNDTSVDPPSVEGSNPGEKNRNCINYEWQQAQSRQSSIESSSHTPISESSQPPPVGNSGPLCAQLTREDLEIPKLDPSEVQRNLRESSDESLMEHSQKQFCSPETATSHGLFYPLMKMASEVSGSQGSGRHVDTPVTILPKQQNVPKRPSSLSLNAKPCGKTSTLSSSSLRMKFGKLGKSNLKKVEMGVAKANAVSMAHEPRLITVANNDAAAAVIKYATGAAPESVGSAANAADVRWKGAMTSENLNFGILNTSPDEQEPLLRREPHPDNANNNNSNNNNGEGDGEGDTEGGGEEGENSESVGPTGDAPSASTVEPVALPDPCPTPALVPPQAQTQAQTHGEALLRQNRVRRPERPNSLDLSITTLPLLGKSADDVTEGSGDKIKKRVKTPYALKKWRPASWVITTDTLDAEVNNNRRHGGPGQAGTSRPKSASAVYLGSRGGSRFSDPSDCDF